jgi:hypothetical protein
MRRAYIVCLFQCLSAALFWAQSSPIPLANQTAKRASPIGASTADAGAQARILHQYGKLPLSFEANHGQADGRVKFLSRTGGYTLFLTRDEAVLALSGKKAKNPALKRAAGGVLRMKLRNANPEATISGLDATTSLATTLRSGAAMFRLTRR